MEKKICWHSLKMTREHLNAGVVAVVIWETGQCSDLAEAMYLLSRQIRRSRASRHADVLIESQFPGCGLPKAGHLYCHLQYNP